MPLGVTAWAAADNKWKQNLNSTTSSTATSLGTGNNGPNGTDIAYPIALSDTRWLWVFGDSFWPTAGGQTRPASRLVGNMVALQVGQDFATSTLTFHCGPRPGTTTVSNTDPWPFFAHKPHPPGKDSEPGQPGCVRYPMAGIRLNAKMVLVVGMAHMANANFTDSPSPDWQGVGGAAGTTPVGPWAVILHGNIDGANPNAWAHQEVEVDLPLSPAGHGQRMGFHFGGGLDIVDDHLVVWCMGPWDQTGHWSVCRYPLEEVEQGLMLAPEWWVGDGRWVADRDNARRRVRVTPTEVQAEQGGAVFRREFDGRYQLTVVPQRFFDPAETNRQQGNAQIKYAVANEPGEAFGPLKTMYEIPTIEDDFDFRYGANVAYGQEWTGNFAPNHQVVVYSTHNSAGSGLSAAVFTNSRVYWPKMLQVTNA